MLFFKTKGLSTDHKQQPITVCILSSGLSKIKLVAYFLSFQLLYLGRDYPAGEQYFQSKLKRAFMKHREETDPEKIKMLIARGEYVIKELEALYMLRKYRTLKQRYYEDEQK